MPNRYQLPQQKKVDLQDIDTKDTGKLRGKEEVEEEIQELKEELQKLQEKLAAGRQQALLVIFQGMDCSGKDGVIKRVFSGLNPQGISAHSFKTPTDEESKHDFLWRAHQHVPALGQITVFNRSYYEEVLITRVHGTIKDQEAKRRFKSINHFESLLDGSHVKIVKIYLHISKDFQLEKIKSRIEDPSKNWKFDPSDLAEREHWEAYTKYYEKAMEKCSSTVPWHVVPSDHRWYRDYAVLQIVVEAMRSLELKDPEPNPEVMSYWKQLEESNAAPEPS